MVVVMITALSRWRTVVIVVMVAIVMVAVTTRPRRRSGRAGRVRRRAVMAVNIEQAAEEAAMVVDHVLEIPAGLFVVFVHFLVVMREVFFVFVHEAAVADADAAFAKHLVRRLAPALAAVALAGLVDEAIMFAMPAFQTAIVIAPPIAIAAIVGTAPPADIVGAFARTVHVVALVRAIPAMPVAVLAAALVIFAATLAIPSAAIAEVN